MTSGMRRGWGQGRFMLLCLFLILALQAVSADDFETPKNELDPLFGGAWAIEIADMDNDGDNDIVALPDDGLAYFENTGAGTFAARVDLDDTVTPALDGPTSLAIGDVDQDGLLDIVTNGENNSLIAWFRNTGGGTFTAANAITTTFDFPSTVRLADMDGDGDLDVVAVRSSISDLDPDDLNPGNICSIDIDGEVAWFENDGSPLGSWTMKTTIDDEFRGTTGVDVGDFDEDGDVDVTAVKPIDFAPSGSCPFPPPSVGFAGDVVWYDNTNGNGTAFSKITIDPSLTGAFYVSTGDIDSDGDEDILVAASDLEVAVFGGDPNGELVWYENNDGTFAAKQSLNTVTAYTGNTLADLDLDGDLDALAAAGADGEVQYFENTVGDGTGWAQSTIDAAFPYALRVTTGDIDGDGDPDIAGAAGNVLDATEGEIGWWQNNMGGQRDVVFAAPQVILDNAGVVSYTDVATGDVDDDGDIDVVAPIPGSSTIDLQKNDNLTWTGEAVTNPTDTGEASVAVDVADSNNDGTADVAGIDSAADEIGFWTYSTGSSDFTLNTLNTPIGGTDVVMGDITNNGYMDVVAATQDSGGEIRWWANNIGDFLTASEVIDGAFSGAHAVAVGDLDNDGLLDVVGASNSDTGADELAWWWADADRSGSWDQEDIGDFPGAVSLDVGDVDNDGDLDILAGSITNNTVTVWFNNGASAWTSQDAITNIDDPYGIAFADFDLDGDLDVVAADLEAIQAGADPDEPIIWSENLDGLGTSWSLIPATLYNYNATDGYEGPIALSVDDIDGDADFDVVVAYQDSGSLIWFENLRGPAVVTNNGLSVNENADDTVITSAMLHARDGDSPATSLEYTLTGMPTGVLSLSGTALSMGETFFQSDINSGVLTYNPNGQFETLQDNQTDTDSFMATLDDGDRLVLIPVTFNITVTGVSAEPVLVNNNPLQVTQGETATITSGELSYSDVDNSAMQLVYNVTALPTNGSLSRTTFSQLDIDNGLVTYTHDGSATTTDSFNFTLTDGDTTLNGTFTIEITPNGTPEPTDEPTPDPGDEIPDPGETLVGGNLTSGAIFPTIRWTPPDDGTGNPDFGEWYNIRITDQNGNIIVDIWLPVHEVCDSETCSYTLTPDDLPAGLLNGSYTVQISVWSDDGAGVVPNGDPITFQVDVPTSTGPENVNVDGSKPYVEIIVDGDDGASWYHIYIGSKDYSTTYFFGWIPKPDTCDGAAPCSLFPFVHLPSGTYSLWMQTWGPAGFNDNNPNSWTEAPDIVINFDAPGTLVPLTPTNTDSGRPTFSWAALEGATWYNLYIGTEDFDLRFLDWFWSVDIGCHDALTCTAVPNAVLENNGTYTWWMRAWGPGGFSTSDVDGGWVEGGTFEVSATTTGTATLLTPTGTINDSSPDFSWQAVEDASWYKVDVESGSASIYSDWHPAESLNCAGGVCTLADADISLPDNVYRWFVTAYSPAGIGATSDKVSFTVQR